MPDVSPLSLLAFPVKAKFYDEETHSHASYVRSSLYWSWSVVRCVVWFGRLPCCIVCCHVCNWYYIFSLYTHTHLRISNSTVHAWGHWNIFGWSLCLLAFAFVASTFVHLLLQHELFCWIATIHFIRIFNYH
jgi:hypothetical protein